jgi:hypothetical protein
MRLSHKTLAVLLSIGWASVSVSYGHQEPVQKSTLRVVQLNGVDMANILAHFANEYGVVIGLETDRDKPKSRIELHLRGVTWPQILDGIVQAEPLYQWRENGKFIEFVPARGEPSLLDTPITNFQITDANRIVALGRLLDLAEVRERMLSMNLRALPLDLQTDSTKDEKLSFNLSGVTLRQALNRISEESRGNFWVFRRFPDGSFEIRLSCC